MKKIKILMLMLVVVSTIFQGVSLTNAAGIPQVTQTVTWSEVASMRLLAYDSKPIDNKKFLVSCAVGQTVRTSTTVSFSATISFGGNYTSGVKDVLCKALVGNVSGTFGYTIQKDTSYFFDAKAEQAKTYNSCDFYGAIGYDKYETVINTYTGTKGTTGIIYNKKLVNTTTCIDNKPKKVEYVVYINRR